MRMLPRQLQYLASLSCLALWSFPVSAALGSLPQDQPGLPPTASLRGGAACERDPASGEIRLLGADYGAQLGADGLRLVPFLGGRVERTQHLGLQVVSLERGGQLLWSGPGAHNWSIEGLLAQRPLSAGIHERAEAREQGVELSYWFQSQPAGQGDLVVRLAVDSSFGSPEVDTDQQLQFLTGSPGQGSGVSVGAVTGIAADGARCAGRLDYQDGQLLLCLPGEFVDQAAYPLVLDPLVGPVVTLSSEGQFSNNDDFQPDLAFDADTDQVLVAWERRVSASETRVFARRFSAAGVPTSNTVQLSTLPVIAGSAGRPAVANISANNRWCVVWQEQEESLTPGIKLSSIQIAYLDTAFTVAPAHTTVHSVFGDVQVDPDVGTVHSLTNLFGAGMGLVVWRDEELDRLAMRAFTSVGAGTVSYGPTQTLVADSSTQLSSVTYTAPSISRSAVSSSLEGAQRQVVVAKALTTGVFAGSKVRAFLLRSPNLGQLDAALLSAFDLHVPTTGGVNRPDIDGLDRRWVCAFEASDALGNPYIRALPLTLDGTGNGVQIGALVDVVAPSSLFDNTRPCVGYAPGKTWIGWRSSSAVSTTTSLRLRAYDSTSLTPSEGPFTLGTGNGDLDEWVAVATAYSGGPYVDAYTLQAPISGLSSIPNYPSENAFAVWSANDSSGTGDILGQALVGNSNGGSIQDLGGGCGSQGLVTFPKNPALGSSAWRSVIANLPNSTAAAFYNLSTANPASASPCGVCLWLPFEVSGSAPLLSPTPSSKQAVVQLTIPAKPTLVGAQLSLQWTLVDPSASPCPTFPGISNSAIWRLTLGL